MLKRIRKRTFNTYVNYGIQTEDDMKTLAENPSYTELLQLEDKIRDMRLKGVPSIERANVQLDDKTASIISQQLEVTFPESRHGRNR